MMKSFLVRDLLTVGVPTRKTEALVVDIARFLIEHNVKEMVVLGYEELVRAHERDDIASLTAEQALAKACLASVWLDWRRDALPHEHICNWYAYCLCVQFT
jgi:hypothetical protein